MNHTLITILLLLMLQLQDFSRMWMVVLTAPLGLIGVVPALLVFQAPDLPAPLTTLSPWLDMAVRPVEQVHAHLEAQSHRRFIKTHTPFDGLPYDERVTYLCVGRDPRARTVPSAVNAVKAAPVEWDASCAAPCSQQSPRWP